VGELKVHWNGGGSVRYLPALLLDDEHHEGSKRRVRVTWGGAHLTRFLYHASSDMAAAGLKLWRSLKPRFVSHRGFHSSGDSGWQGSSGSLIPMVIEQTVSWDVPRVVSR